MYLWILLFDKELLFKSRIFPKAELLCEGIIFLVHLFARAISLMKKKKIEEIKAT